MEEVKMSNLYAFLHPEMPEQKEVVFSRFKDENGKVVPFLIRPLTTEENNALMKKCKVKEKSGKTSTDTARYQLEVVVAGTVRPDFTDSELCEGWGVVDPTMVVGKMLFSGEYARLAEEIIKLSGFDEDSADEAEEEAKN